MLLIVTVGLVLAGIVLLIIGLVLPGPGYIYLSMACAVLAALTLFVFSRLARRSAGRSGRSERPEPVERGERRPSAPVTGNLAPEPKTDDTAVVPAAGGTTEAGTAKDSTTVSGRVAQGAAGWQPPVRSGSTGGSAVDADGVDDDVDVDDEVDDIPAAVEVGAHQPVAAAGARPSSAANAVTDTDGDAVDEDWDDDDWDDEFVFPIEDYDDLRVAEILPILVELEDDELIDVRDREAAGKARGTILRRIETLLGGRSEAEAAPAAPAPATPAARAVPTPPAAPARKAPAVTPPAAPPVPAAPTPRRRGAARTREPIPGYESLRVAQILPMLGELSHPDLATIEATERAGANRATVLKRIDRLRAGAKPG
ncbi:MAG: hypothetical protein ACR2MN_09870 [Acidimicrobiales bacterium]